MTLAEHEAREYERWLDQTTAQQPDLEPEEVAPLVGALRFRTVCVSAAYRAEAPAVDPRQLFLRLTLSCSVCGGPVSGMADVVAGQHVTEECGS